MAPMSALTRLLALTGLGIAAAGVAAYRRPPAQVPVTPFPEDFKWGVALAGFQSEGSSPDSNWSRYVDEGAPMIRTPFGEGPQWLTRFEEDIALAAGLGVNTFRFSVEWARIETAPGVIDEDGWAFYDAVVDTLERHGISPMITLDHWVYPGWVVDKGRWQWEGVVDAWMGHAERVVRRYAGRGATWITINEPQYYLDCEKKNLHLTRREQHVMQTRLLEAHRRAYALIHELDPGALVSSNLACVPAPLHLISDAWFFDRCGDTLDFLGIDYYYGLGLDNLSARFDNVGEYWRITMQPESLLYMLRIYHKKRPDLPIWIVEHGMPTDNEQPRFDGLTRAEHLRDHIYFLQRAADEGIPVIGYNYWSLTDNYEWGSYRPRFGLYSVDVLGDPSLERRPTDGVDAYREIIAERGVRADYQPVSRPGFGIFSAPWETTFGRLM